MLKRRILRLMVHARRKRMPLTASFAVCAVFALFQNCGQKSQISQNQVPGDGSNQQSSVPIIVANAVQQDFSASGFFDFSITNQGSVPALQVTASGSFPQGAFSFATNACSGVSLPPGASCLIRVSFVQATTAKNGAVTVNYRDQNNNPMPSLTIMLTGSSSIKVVKGDVNNIANQQNVQAGVAILDLGNGGLGSTPTPTPAPTPDEYTALYQKCSAVNISGIAGEVHRASVNYMDRFVCMLRVPDAQRDSDNPACPAGWFPVLNLGMPITRTFARTEQEHTNATGGRANRTTGEHPMDPSSAPSRESMTICTWRNWTGCRQWTTYKAWVFMHACLPFQ